MKEQEKSPLKDPYLCMERHRYAVFEELHRKHMGLDIILDLADSTLIRSVFENDKQQKSRYRRDDSIGQPAGQYCDWSQKKPPEGVR